MGAILGGAAIIGGTSLLGGLLSKGSKPKIPELKPIDFAAEQKQAIQQNLAALEPATELAKKTTAAEQSQLEAQLRRAIPGYDQMVQQASQNIGAALKGELPTDVQQQIQRSTAGRALAGGFGGGSGFGRALTARDLGLTSLQLQNQGLAQAQNFIQQQRAFGMVQPFSVSSMFITPAQRVGAMQQQQQAMYNRNLQAAQVAAMPDPTMAAIGSAISSAGGFAGGAYTQRGLMQQMPSNLYATTPGGSPSVSSTTIDYSTGETGYLNPMSPAATYAVPPSTFYPGRLG
jgi:hypothetical protein